MILHYVFCAIFMAAFAIVLGFLAENLIGQFWIVGAFVFGGLTSMTCGLIGKIATISNVKTV